MKKIVKVLAAGALVASALTVVACKDDNTSTTTSAPTSGGSVTTSAPTSGGSSTTVAPTTKPQYGAWVTGDGKGTTVDMNLRYMNGNENYGVTYRQADAATGLGGETLIKDTLLPTWSAIQAKLNVNIKEGSNFTAADVKTMWQDYIKDGFKNDSQMVDLIMADGTQSGEAANNGLLYSIDELLEKGLLPNFQKWLDTVGGGKTGANWSAIKSADGKVYYTPYFAGEFGTVEKHFMMNVDMVKKLLDDENPNFDTTPAKTSAFKAHVAEMKNEKIKVSTSSDAANPTKEITVSYDKSIVTLQNELTTKNGRTYTEALRNYIDEVYGEYIGEGKLYKTRSEIFTTEQACYNADEMVALLRCVQNNPQLLTGTDLIYAMAPRAIAANRQASILQLASIWGIKGLAGENGRLYYDKNGELLDGRTQMATYEALDDLHELYNEGFFPEDYYSNTDTSSDSYRKKYLKSGQLFMMYDFNAGTTAFNSDATEGSLTHHFEAVMPPVAEWDDGEGTGENRYFHYTEDILSLKKGGFCIPKTTDNLEGACAVMDYMWCPEGNDLQDYGPNTTDYRNGVTKYDANGDRIADNYDAAKNPNGATMSLGGSKFCVMWSKKVTGHKEFISGWNNFCRKYIGTTHGLGHQRSPGMDIQTTVSLVGRAGFAKLTAAVSTGVLRTAGEAGSGIFQSVPTNITVSAYDTEVINNNKKTSAMETFWKESKNETTSYSYWICEGSTGENVQKKYEAFGGLSAFYDSFEEIDSIYLVAYRLAVGA